jgi:hypothetical protein
VQAPGVNDYIDNFFATAIDKNANLARYENMARTAFLTIAVKTVSFSRIARRMESLLNGFKKK